MALLIALVGQGWNLLGGYGGQYSFGHAAFFGTGAYVTAILQMRYGVNAWLGLVDRHRRRRARRRGDRRAKLPLRPQGLVLRAGDAGLRRGAPHRRERRADHRRRRRHADQARLRPEAFQFQSRVPFYLIIVGMVGLSLILVVSIENSRFGAYLVAVRENEEAAKALGVDVTLVKLGAMTLSAAITAAGGCFYAQYFLFLDAAIAYGPWISIEALLAPIVGGVGTVFGPLLGALVVKALGELTKMVAATRPASIW